MKVGEGKEKLITQGCNLPNWDWAGEDDGTKGSSEVHVHMHLENSISSPRSLILIPMGGVGSDAKLHRKHPGARVPHSDLLERAGGGGVCFTEDAVPPHHS